VQYNSKDDCFAVRNNVPLNESVRTLVNKLCEMGWLFKKINEILSKDPQGLVNQSLFLAIKEELNEYFRLIAILENLINKDTGSYNANNNN
jgi:gamma-tubulin complex component 3